MGLKIMAQLGLDGSAFHQGMTRADAQAKRFAHAMSHEVGERLAEVFTIGAVVEFGRKMMETADKIINMSRQLGVSVEWLQEMQFAAKHAGVEVETLATFVERLSGTKFDMSATGKVSPQRASALAQFGLTPEVFVKQTAQETVDAIGKAMKGSNAQEFAGALRTLGGRGADALAGMFIKGIEDAREEARARGQILTEDVIIEFKVAEEEMSIMAKMITVQLAPALMQAVEVLYKAYAGVKMFTTGLIEAIISMRWTKTGGPALKALLSGIPGGQALDFTSGMVTNSNPIDAFKNAVAGEFEDSQKFIKSITDMMDEVRKSLGRPAGALPFAPPGVGGMGKFHPMESDALVRVGNFLGTGRNTLESLANRQVALLVSIDKNTKKMADRSTQADPDPDGLGGN